MLDFFFLMHSLKILIYDGTCIIYTGIYGEEDRYGHMSIQLLLKSHKTDSFDDHLCYNFTLNAEYRDDIKRHLYLEIYYESTSYETSIFSSIAMKSLN